MTKTLPSQPHIDWLKKSAKECLAERRKREPSARLHQAQLDVAHDYGFASWRALKAHVDALSVDGQVIAATLAGNARELARLITAHPRKLGITGGPSRAPLLHLAAEAGHLDCVSLLLRQGFDVDKRDHTDNATALHWAASSGHLDVAKRLLAAGADIDGAGDGHALGVIGWATCFKAVYSKFAEFLLSRGARPTIFSSVALGREDLARALVTKDRSLLGLLKMSRFDHYRSALHLAVLKNRPTMVRLLLELGADPRQQDNRGYTALNFANAETDPAIVDLLLAAGAQPTERNVNRFEQLTPVLNVANMAASLDYYVGKLGFRKLFDWGDPPTFAGVGRDGIKIFLSHDEGSGLTSLTIFVQNVDQLYEDYKSSGAAIRLPPTNFTYGVRGMDVEDPDGHRLRFSSDGGEHYRSEQAA